MIKLNGGLGTSMGMDRAKSLLCVRRGLSFLDIIARQVLHLRQEYDAPLPLLFMNSFRTSADTMAALARYDDLPVDGLPLEFLQNKEPKLLAKDLDAGQLAQGPRPRVVPARPRRPLHRAARHRPARRSCSTPGYERVFVSNSDNLGAVPDARVAGWFAAVGCAVRDRGGAPYRLATARAATSPAARPTAGSCCARPRRPCPRTGRRSADLDRHRFCSTNNLWFDLRAMQRPLDGRDGILGLPLIRNDKTVDPGDPATPEGDPDRDRDGRGGRGLRRRPR